MEDVIPSSRPLTLITGASSGIGLELARQFSRHGHDLIICSGSDNIFDAANELSFQGTSVEVVKANLATYEGVEELYSRYKSMNRPLEAAVINAGVGLGGEFVSTKLKDEIEMIKLNNLSAVHLTKRLLPDMYQRKSGRILFTSSITAVMPAPFEAVYGATKAFLSSFAEAIRNEAKPHGVSVTILMPGPTETNFFHRAKMDNTLVGSKLKSDNDPAEVAKVGFEALMSGKEKVFAESLKTKIQGLVAEYLPDRLKAEIHRRMSEPNPKYN